MTDLVQKHCVPCEGGALPLMREESAKLLQETPGWTIAPDGLSLSREFAFKNFVDAMGFANKITPLAEAEGHHPDLSVSWGKVIVTLMTHAIGGLSENDFILAAKINTISQ
jgi:4a-hydroxytetrahydrobiopterin dehydratase